MGRAFLEKVEGAWPSPAVPWPPRTDPRAPGGGRRGGRGPRAPGAAGGGRRRAFRGWGGRGALRGRSHA